MLGILYAQVNITCAIVLVLMLNSLRKRGSIEIPFDQRLFNGVMFLNIIIFVFDTSMWLLDGNDFPFLRLLNYIATTGYYILNPLICFWWLLYTDYKIFDDRLQLLKRVRLYAIPVVISAVISIVSPFTGWYFIIDEANVYKRGPLFPVMFLFAAIYLLTSIGIALNDIRKNGWIENKSVYLHLVIFPLSIFVAAILQSLFFGLSIIWVCTMLACTSLYIYIQNGEISTDHLTGLLNRRRLNHFLLRKFKVRQKGPLLFAMMLDLDKFKAINDNFGHLVGDDALIQTASIIRNSSIREDFIARMGGDEFIIIGERANTAEIEQLMKSIQTKIIDFNTNGQVPYVLSISVGYSVFGDTDTIDSFLADADKKMYHMKLDRHRQGDGSSVL